MPASYHSIFTGQVLFLMPNQHCQSTKGVSESTVKEINLFAQFSSDTLYRNSVFVLISSCESCALLLLTVY